jgi:hypothetical protein
VPSTVQARFYAYNTDNKGAIAVTADAFTVTRPHAVLIGIAASSSGVVYTSGFPDIPPALAQTYPFADVATGLATKEICLVTVLLPASPTGPTGSARVERNGDSYTAHILAGATSRSVRVIDAGEVPEFEVQTP